MRIERWYWLFAFCAVSLCIHVGIVMNSRSFAAPVSIPKVQEIEITLQPLPEEKPIEKAPEKPKPAPKPVVKAMDRGKPFTPQAKRVSVLPPAPVVAVRKLPNPEMANVKKEPKVASDQRKVAPNVDPGGIDPLKEEKPLPLGLPSGQKDAGPPKLTRIARADIPLGGGGSPAPGIIPGGKGGAPGPEAPPEDILFNGGGAGGMNLPREAPRIGGGGGRSILSVENPLAKDAIPEDKPGLGPGLGAGQGAGAGGGVGYGRGQGIGTSLDGKVALGTLRAKPGVGIGAGVGTKIGTNPPGGGRGTGAELPGTGGTGIGYGRGSGIGVGNGSGVGVGDGAGGGRPGRMRGVPFGDIAGILNGDPNGGGGRGGGPGGPGRGSVFGANPGGGKASSAPLHIVYVVDSSGSMQQGNKIGKAKEALKQALSELKPKDTFNIVNFDNRNHIFSEDMVPATPGNIEAANRYVDDIRLSHHTNMSGGLDFALSMEGISHIYLMSDGIPEGGIEAFDELRAFVKEHNKRKVKIMTLALGLGEQFAGMVLLKGLADDNDGSYAYINLAKVMNP